MPLKENIKRYRLAAHMTLENVANAIGVSKQTVQKYESGVIGNIPSDKIENMAKAFGCSPADLMGWRVSQFPSNALPIPSYHMVPVIGEIACGTPILAEQNIEGYEPCPDFAHADFCLRCHGDSMIGAEIHDGDVVFIHKQPEVENGQIAAVQIEDGDCYNATLKRFYRSGDTVTLMAENPSVPPLVFTRDDINKIHIAGRAVYCLSKIK